MAEIIPFRAKPQPADEEVEIDLFTAVDVAIRDLREIAEQLASEASRRQAEECRLMLERALSSAT